MSMVLSREPSARWLLRPAREADAAGVQALVATAFGPWLDRDRIAALVRQTRASPAAGMQHVALDGASVVGHVLAARGTGACQHVADVSICVDRRLRRRGIASLLLREADRWARRQGVVRLVAVCEASNAPAVELFRRNGYRLEAPAMADYRLDPRGEGVTCSQLAKRIERGGAA